MYAYNLITKEIRKEGNEASKLYQSIINIIRKIVNIEDIPIRLIDNILHKDSPISFLISQIWDLRYKISLKSNQSCLTP